MIVASLNLKQHLWNLCINTQHILLAMIEDIKISRGNKQFCAAILTDLSKTLDWIR